MKSWFALCASLLLFASASPASLMAQFQPPNADELKMTSDPKAPGVAAVYLYREEIADDVYHVRSYYDRIKVLTEKGTELATVHIPYERGEFKITGIKGRTIHPDGTIVPLTVKPEDLVDFKSKNYQEDTIVFTLPGVEVGSILEYRLEMRYDDRTFFSPHWDIQTPYFIHKAHFSFHPSSVAKTNSKGDRIDNLAMVSTRKQTDVQHVKDSYVLDLSDIPPTPSEDWMPPLNTITWSVDFYYTNASSLADFWKTEGKSWVSSVEKFASPSDTLRSAVNSLVSQGDSEEVKASKIYAAVMKLDNTDFTREKSESERKKQKLKDIESAEDLWKQQSGTGNELALLYMALARVAGLQVSPMKVVNRSRATFDPDYLSMSQLDDIVDIVSIGGKEIFLDPGQKMCPFGSLKWDHELAGGIRSTASGSAIATTPGAEYKQNMTRQNADLTIDERGRVTGTVRYVLSGTEALYWRQAALENDEDAVKKQFKATAQRQMPDGVEADVDHFIDLNEYEAPLMAVVNVSGNMGTTTGKHLILPGLFFENNSSHPFVAQEKRATPIDLHFAEQIQDEVIYHLPTELAIESSPKTDDLNWPGKARLRINSEAKDGTLVVTRGFARGLIFFPSSDYSTLRDFYQKLTVADQQQIVLAQPETPRGN